MVRSSRCVVRSRRGVVRSSRGVSWRSGAWLGERSGVWGLSRHREFWGYVSVKVFLKRLLEN